MPTPASTYQTSKISYLKKAFGLAKDYFFNSDDRVKAWFSLIGIILSIIAITALFCALSWWNVGFWAAIAAKDLVLFAASMKTFAVLLTGLVGLHVLKNYLIENLGIGWRNWLTKKLLGKYIAGKNNYLDLMRQSKQIDNPQQRIQEDIQTVVDSSLSLSTEFLKSTFSLFTFIGTLWVVGGAFSFILMGASITIPGYLVWLAIIIAVAASAITKAIGKPLGGLNKKSERLEADFRKEMDVLNNEAESIAQEQGDIYYKDSLTNKFNKIVNNSNKRLSVNTKLLSFQNFYMQISSILPYVLAAPLYFSGLIEIGSLMQVGFAFGEVNNSFSWFVNSYQELATYTASLDRLIQLDQALEGKGLISTKKGIKINREKDGKEISIKNLNLAYPSSTKQMLREFNLKLTPGTHTLIKGPSGFGKSTLFKAIAGTWRYGTGEITRPDRSICFLAQKPSIPNAPLRAVLAYPDPVETYTDEQYIAVLRAVGGNMEQFIPQLGHKQTWSTKLSPGQQQRISFARVLLKKPDWIFLDEATSALDPESERHVYRLLKEELRNSTLISIAHRTSVEEFHDNILDFKAIEQSLSQGQANNSPQTTVDGALDSTCASLS